MGTPIDDFLLLLRGVKPVGDGKWMAYCPVHESSGEHDPSLSVTVKTDGTVLLKCFACPATNPEIVHAAGSTMRALFPPREQGSKNKGRRVAEYIYRDADGAIAYRAERWEKNGTKTFTQAKPNGQGGWIPSVKGVPRVLYRLPELIAAPAGSNVFVVEGEKKVEALREWGLVATCNVGGAGKWKKDYAKYLKGHHVVILPDNDPINHENGRRVGYDHARDISESAQGIAASILILELPDLPLKGDIVDWKAAGGTLSRLLQLLEEARAASLQTPESAAAESKPTPASEAVKTMDPLDVRLPEARSDTANARRLFKLHGADLRYCDPWKKWLIWDGRRWRSDDTLEIRRRATDVCDKLWTEWRGVSGDVDEATYAKIGIFAKTSSSSYGIEKMIDCAGSLAGAQVIPSDLDSDPWLLNCTNGTVDLITGELNEHQREKLVTKMSPTKFDPDAKSPNWDKFLKDIFETDELIAYVRRLCGYWATGVIREQMLPVLFGTGSNGKTTFLNAICRAIGSDFCMKAPADFIMQKRTDSHPTDKADLFGKRLVVCSETDDGKRLAESTVKELTGDEPIRARRMREDFWEFRPTHKIILVTNHKPLIRGTDHGIWRRIRLIPFLKQFWNPNKGESGPDELRQDDTLKNKLEEENSGILTWIVRGCIEWHQDGEQAPECVDSETREYRSSQDILGSFIEERCDIASNYVVRSTELYKAYRKWAENNGEYVVNQRQFGLSMNERGFQRFKNSEVWYQGIALGDELAD